MVVCRVREESTSTSTISLRPEKAYFCDRFMCLFFVFVLRHENHPRGGSERDGRASQGFVLRYVLADLAADTFFRVLPNQS